MFIDLLKADRSYRGYDETRRITEEELKSFVDYTRYTPSSVNKQPLKYYLVWKKEELAKVQAMTGWAKGLPELTLPHQGMCPTGFIIICQDTRIDASLTRYQRDVGIAAHTMLLAATEKGLGGCMIGNFGAAQVKEGLGLSEELMPMLIVAFGKPMEKVVLTEIEKDGDTSYYRDEEDVHYVPKRKLEDIIL